MTKLVLHLGSNLGARNRYLRQARTAITERVGPVIAHSPIYETSAWGLEDQRDFLNIALLVETERTPHEVLTICQSIEKDLGRERIVKWGSRTVDIDLIFYGDLVLKTPNLILPHPLFAERRFVLAPLADVVPQWQDPRSGRSVQVLLMACKGTGWVKRVV
ncbi:MAG: 2-amino-4-hydroxy-6-hydroxymethyldihydropteridine diphosphokinase [Bacteroidota bacterium]